MDQNGENYPLKTQKFIKRLYAATSDPKIHTITWTHSGTSFSIPNKELFRTTTMSKISKTKEYTAFLRSLHHYNFKRIRTIDDEADEYSHPYFVRGREDLLGNIHRSVSKTPAADMETVKSDIGYVQNNIAITNQNLYMVSEEISELRKKVDDQEKTINGLIEVLSKVFRIGISGDNVQPALTGNLSRIIGRQNESVEDLLQNRAKETLAKRTKTIPKLEITPTNFINYRDLQEKNSIPSFEASQSNFHDHKNNSHKIQAVPKFMASQSNINNYNNNLEGKRSNSNLNMHRNNSRDKSEMIKIIPKLGYDSPIIYNNFSNNATENRIIPKLEMKHINHSADFQGKKNPDLPGIPINNNRTGKKNKNDDMYDYSCEERKITDEKLNQDITEIDSSSYLDMPEIKNEESEDIFKDFFM